MLRRIGTFLLIFCMLSFVGTISLTHISVADDSHKCTCQSGKCKCGADCKCEHCAKGKGRCQCKSDGKGGCLCGKDCKCEHCSKGKGRCQCESDGKDGCKCGRDCKCAHCGAGAEAKEKPASDADYAISRISKNGIFKASYSTETAVAINQIHSWKLKIETADGKAVKDAEITVTGNMPEHGHGLPTQPKVTKDFGDGTYLVEGIKFSMPGWWVMIFQIKEEGKSDSVTFNLMLK